MTDNYEIAKMAVKSDDAADPSHTMKLIMDTLKSSVSRASDLGEIAWDDLVLSCLSD